MILATLQFASASRVGCSIVRVLLWMLKCMIETLLLGAIYAHAREATRKRAGWIRGAEREKRGEPLALCFSPFCMRAGLG